MTRLRHHLGRLFLLWGARLLSPPPRPTNGPAVWDLVIADVERDLPPGVIRDRLVRDMRARDALGVVVYGTRLQAGNGRDARHDGYCEDLDGTAYTRQDIEEETAHGVGRRLRAIYQHRLRTAYATAAELWRRGDP